MKDKAMQAVFWLGTVLIVVAAVVGFCTGIAFVNEGTPPPDTQACQVIHQVRQVPPPGTQGCEVRCSGGHTGVECDKPFNPKCYCDPNGVPVSKCVDPAEDDDEG